MGRRLLRLDEVKKMTGKSRSAIYDDTSFPRPVKIGTRSAAWVCDEVETWIEGRIEARKE